MHRILVNALSVTNQSGLHGLVGYLAPIADGLRAECSFVVLCRADQTELKRRLGDRVDWLDAPARTARWTFRTAWEFCNLKRITRETGTSIYYTTSGIAAHLLPVPQVVFCQNPWALVPAARRRRDAPKAWMQRWGYRAAMRRAAAMVFISRYLQDAYRRNAGRHEQHGVVMHYAAEDATREHAQQWVDRPRDPDCILCVSAMAPHKNIETLLLAFDLLRRRGHPHARLHLVGAWPDPAYERRIRQLASAAGLLEYIRFSGFVAREELDRLYAEARIFCLLSRCESFGIPAIEAQLFGTPVVCSSVCAVPEVCGDGGLFFDPDDADGVADALHRLLTDSAEWTRLSALARSNGAKYTWELCSRSLAELFERMMENKHE